LGFRGQGVAFAHAARARPALRGIVAVPSLVIVVVGSGGGGESKSASDFEPLARNVDW